MTIDLPKLIKNPRVIILLLLAFLTLRIGVAVVGGQTDFEGFDSPSYFEYAKAILTQGDWLTNPDFPGHYREPVYPLVIAGVYGLFGIDNNTALYIVQAILNALTCWLIFLFARELFNDSVAFLTLLWSGFYIYYLNWVRMLYRETLVFLLLFALFFSLYLYLKKDGTVRFALMTGLYTLLIHTDARYLFYLPFLVILFILLKSFKPGLRRYFGFLGLTLALMIPWIVRNAIAYDYFVLINTRTFAVTMGTTTDATYFGQRINRNLMGRWPESSGIKNELYPSEEERRLVKQGLNPNGRSEAEIEAIMKDEYAASGYLKRKLFWLGEFWRPARFNVGYSPLPFARFQKKYSWPHNLSSLACYGFLLPFAIFGLFHLVRRKNEAGLFLAFPIAIQTLLHILMWGRERYRLPIDSFIMILGLYGLWMTVSIMYDRIIRPQTAGPTESVP